MYSHSSPRGLSRARIETLCILDAVGAGGCRAQDLAAKLGLSATLSGAVLQGTRPLVEKALLTHDEAGMIRLTDAGRELLATTR